MNEAPNAPTAAEVVGIEDRAWDELTRLCAGYGRTTHDGRVGRSWTMSIPARDGDSDCIFADLITECRRLRAALLAARREVEAMQSAAQGALDTWLQHAEMAEEWGAIETLRTALAATPEEK